MSDPDRGAYTPPTDSPLAFDARRPVRGGGPASSTLMISAAILVLLVAGAGVWLYKDGQRGASDEPQPVGTAVVAAKAPPPAVAQPEDEAAGLQIYKQDDLAAEPTFAPAPEAVQPRPQPQPAAPVQTAELRPALPATPAAATPAEAPPARPVQAAAARPAAGGAAMVQIGAFSSQAQADKGWTDAASVAPGLAAGKGKHVEAIDKDGTTLYRTAVTGFSSRAEAQVFCDRLKGAGKNCFVK
ncbi:MAG: SPOR domain-containing protein [Pseudomonadota bacterium]